jgi:hypothetical protein
MQHDSNVQTAEAEIQKFPRSLAEDMFNGNTQFETILHIPTLSVGAYVPEAFEDFLGSMDCATDLIEAHPQFKGLFDSFQEYTDRDWNEEHASNFSRICTEFEFLVQVQSAIPRSFDLTESGEFRSCSIGGHFALEWILAKDMKHAAEQAIQIAEQIFEKALQKARKEQGFEG